MPIGIALAWNAWDRHAGFVAGPDASRFRAERADLSVRQAMLGRQVEARQNPDELVADVIARELDPWPAAEKLQAD